MLKSLNPKVEKSNIPSDQTKNSSNIQSNNAEFNKIDAMIHNSKSELLNNVQTAEINKDIIGDLMNTSDISTYETSKKENDSIYDLSMKEVDNTYYLMVNFFPLLTSDKDYDYQDFIESLPENVKLKSIDIQYNTMTSHFANQMIFSVYSSDAAKKLLKKILLHSTTSVIIISSITKYLTIEN